MNDQRRGSVEPDDWPDEEGRGAAQDGLRDDTGVSMQRPKTEDVPDDEAAGAGLEPGRGELGSTTSGEKGAEQGPR
ncbi:MAG: hypothetical protein M3N29_08945 [Chloroflexota bacterium]|nr:hypothetical protein [Chloroflexota bacterium]